MDRDELKATFYRVTAYRHVCEAVRGSANHTLVSGVFFLIIAALYYTSFGANSPIFLIVAFLAFAEIGVGIWKKVRPSVECVLLDSIINFIFGGSVLVRQFLAWQAVQDVNFLSLFIGCWALYDSWNNFNSYLLLRRAFEVRPTPEQMQYVREMIQDIRAADPESDASTLALPSQPPIKAQLAGDLAFIVDPGSGEAIVVDAAEFRLERRPAANGRPLGVLTLQGQSFPPFELDDANWRNYQNWKGESPVS